MLRVFIALWCCVACAAAAVPVNNSKAPAEAAHHRRKEPPPVFKISAFKDVTAYVLTTTQQRLKGILDVQLKWVRNADEAHADLRSYAADLASMSYDDTLSMALQENYNDVAAAWPVHGSMMNLCGTIDVSKGLVYVGIDTDTGYARMLRQQLKKTLSPEDYAKIKWVYAGATNLRYEQLAAGTLNATLLNPPFTSFLSRDIPCQPFYQLTGPIQGTVGNVHLSALASVPRREVLRTFFECYKHVTLDMRHDMPSAVAGLASFYNVSSSVATNVYNSVWGVDGLQTSFCFEYDRLAKTEDIFSQDTGISVPRKRWWVVNWGCNRHY